MNEIDYQTRKVFGRKKLRKVNTILQKDNFFLVKNFQKNKIKKEREMRKILTSTYCLRILIKEILRCVNYVVVMEIKTTQ